MGPAPINAYGAGMLSGRLDKQSRVLSFRTSRRVCPLLKLIPEFFVIDCHMNALDRRSFHHSCQ